jgi:hypothetical protein
MFDGEHRPFSMVKTLLFNHIFMFKPPCLMVKSQLSSEEVSAFMVKSAFLLLLQGYKVFPRFSRLLRAAKLLFQLRVPLHCQGGAHDLNSAAQREVTKVFLVA